MTQLYLTDEFLSDEFARAPHWVEPPSKLGRQREAPALDYRAWLDHAAECEPCGLARDDLLALRQGALDAEPAVPCPVGIRLVPLEDLDRVVGGMDRGESAAAIRRIVDHARELDGWGPEARMSAGQAWGRLGR